MRPFSQVQSHMPAYVFLISLLYVFCVYVRMLQFFWALGAILEAALALVVMTNMDDDVNWRWLLGLSAIPVGLMSFIFPVSICLVYHMTTNFGEANIWRLVKNLQLVEF